MATKTKAQLITELEANITDNTSGENTAARVREIISDLIDSSLNIVDNPQPLLFKALANTDGLSPITWGMDSNGDVLINTTGVIPNMSFSAGHLFIEFPGLTLDNGKVEVTINPSPVGGDVATPKVFYFIAQSGNGPYVTIDAVDIDLNYVAAVIYNQWLTVTIYP